MPPLASGRHPAREATSTKAESEATETAASAASELHAVTLSAPARPGFATASASKIELLWYCERCTHLILPPGAAGTVSPAGVRLCAGCAPLEANPAAATAVALPRVDSSKVIRAYSSGSSRRFRGLDESDRTPPAPSGTRRVLALTGLAVFLIAASLGLGWLAFGNHKPTAVVATAPPRSNGSDAAPVSTVAPVATDGVRKPLLGENAATSKRAGDAAAPVAATDKFGNKRLRSDEDAARAARFLRVDDFQQALDDVAPLLEAEKYSGAKAALRDIEHRYRGAPWWETKLSEVQQARETLQERIGRYTQAAADAAMHAQTAGNAAELDNVEKEWQPRLQLGEISANLANRVLESAKMSRERLQRAQAPALAAPLDEIARRLAGTPTRLEVDDSVSKLTALRSIFIADPTAATAFGERWAGLNFDAQFLRSPERALFRLETAPVNGAVTLLYDFNTEDQLGAWSLGGASGGGLEFDPSTKTAVLKIDSATPAVAQAALPFCFKADSWSVDGEAALLRARQHTNRDLATGFGIFISDGAQGSLRIMAREGRGGQLDVLLRSGGAPEVARAIPGKLGERVRIRIKADNGLIGISVGTTKYADFPRARLGFEPAVLGLFVESHEADESAAVSFDNIRIAGTLDKQKVKAAYDTRRASEIAAFKASLAPKNAGR